MEALVGLGGAPALAAAEWRQFTSADGRLYWFNGLQSVWTKPLALMTARERADASTDWAEHSDVDGRSYFVNKKSGVTTWALPEELKIAREAAERAEALLRAPHHQPPPSLASLTALAAPAAPPQPLLPHAPILAPLPVVNVVSAAEVAAKAAAARQQTPVSATSSHFANEEEAKEAFKALLTEAGVSAEDSWEKALLRIVHDARYGALASLSRRKAAFNEFVQARAKAEREARRAAEKQAREALRSALLQALHSGRLAPGARPRDAEACLSAHPAWAEVQGMRLEGQAAILQEALHEADAVLREERRKAERSAAQALRSRLDALQAAGRLDASTPWRKAWAELQASPSPGAQDDGLGAAQRLDVFADWLRDAERAEAEAAARAQEAQRRREREARDAFCLQLRLRAADGRLTARSSWRDCAAAMAGDPSYVAVCANLGGSTPRELFTDVLDELADALSADARLLAPALQGRDAESDARPGSLPEVRLQLGAQAAGVSDAHLATILADRAAAAAERSAKGARRAKRAAEAFTAMLRGRPTAVGAAWAEVRGALCGESAFKELPGGDAQAAALWAEHDAALLASGAEPGEVVQLAKESRKEERKTRKRRHHKDRHRSDSSESDSDSDDSRRSGRRSRRRHKDKKARRSRS
jgi:pre-mRNA-processing factor 40